jgi:hypothetical protein
MLDSFEYSGEWWLPENPEKKVHGKLNYNPRARSILILDGALSEKPEAGTYYKIILGISSNGKKMTLRKCLLVKLQKLVCLVQDGM